MRSYLLLWSFIFLAAKPVAAAHPELKSQNDPVTQDDNRVVFPDIQNHQGNITKVIPDGDSSSELYTSLIEEMKKLNILTPQLSCVKVLKISREVVSFNTNSNTKTVGVYLYFQESSIEGNKSDDVDSKENNKTKGNKLQAETGCKTLSKSVITMDAHSLMRDEESSNKTKNGYNGLAGTKSDNTNNTVAGVLVGAHSNNNGGGHDDGPGISRTQLVVISTCSAIIGTFFLVAGIMRIRNYIKRVRQEQALARRPTFRSCSVALRTTAQSNELIRRDSLLSKSSSYQSNFTARAPSTHCPTGASSRENSRNSSPRTYADKTPLLVVTSAFEGNTPTPTISQSSLQYIDEEPIKKKIGNYKNEKGEESKPLLNSDADDSGTVDIGSPFSEELSANLVGDRSTMETICGDNSENDENGFVKSPIEPLSPAIETENVPNAAKVEDLMGQVQNASGETASKEQVTSMSGEVTLDDPVLVPFQGMNGEFDLPDGFAATNFGLTQSDSSLSSANPPYMYGNQTEYRTEDEIDSVLLINIDDENIGEADLLNGGVLELKDPSSDAPSSEPVETAENISKECLSLKTGDENTSCPTNASMESSSDYIQNDSVCAVFPSGMHHSQVNSQHENSEQENLHLISKIPKDSEFAPLINTLSTNCRVDGVTQHQDGGAADSAVKSSSHTFENSENENAQTDEAVYYPSSHTHKNSLHKLLSCEDEKTTFL